MKKLIPFVLLGLLGACAQVETARLAVDAGAAVARKINVEAIYQVDIERKRARSLRCMSPTLTPDALAAAYADPRLGSAWMNELLRDCPQFSGLLGAMAQERLAEYQERGKQGLIQ